jgi:hypothetical protein
MKNKTQYGVLTIIGGFLIHIVKKNFKIAKWNCIFLGKFESVFDILLENIKSRSGKRPRIFLLSFRHFIFHIHSFSWRLHGIEN